MKITHFLRLVLVKVWFNLRSEAAQHRLSYTWWVLEPVLHMGVFYLIFKVLLQRGTDDFVAFLLCGLVPWLWFAKSVTNSSQSIIQGRGIIGQAFIPKAFFPLAAVSQDAVKQSVVFLLLFVFIIISGFSLTINWLWLLPIIISQFLLTMAISFCVAFIVPFARDFRYLVATVLTLGMLGSGVFFSYDQVLSPQNRDLFLLNPMANLLVNYRLVLLHGEAPMIVSLATISTLSLAFLALIFFLMRRFDNNLTRLVVE
jgi:lipopolysaccharide transport system permease protein